MKNQNFKIKQNLFLCSIALLIFSSCKISTEKISKDNLIKNEELILNEVYSYFFKSKEYLIGSRMDPPMQFDCVYVYCLNMNEKNIDLNALKNEKIEMKWDDLTMDEKDVQELIKNNIPIVQMSFHYFDPLSVLSKSLSDQWTTKTYFFPECKSENNKLNLGIGYPIEKRIQSINYFPYFYDNIMNTPMSGGNWLDLKSSDIGQNINYNGTIYKLSDLLNKNGTSVPNDKQEAFQGESQQMEDQGNVNSILFTVTAEKAFFYKESNFKFKRKAYLIKGQNGEFSKRENDFVFAKYTNDDGVETKGWISVNDIEISE